MRRIAPVLALLVGIFSSACSTPRASQSIEVPTVQVATTSAMEVDLQEIDAPHGSPPVGRYFEIRNNSKQPIQIKGYREGNYVQSWQRLEYGVWIDMPKPPSFGSRIQQIALAPGATSVFRGTEGIGGDRVGIEVSQGGHTQIAWSR